MSWDALEWATRLPANDEAHESAMRTLAYLALRANDDGLCWPSVGTIASDRALSRSQVFEHFRLLIAAGLLAREERPGSQVKACRLMVNPSDVPDGSLPNPSDAPDPSRPADTTGPVRSDTTQEKISEEIIEGGARAMPESEAFRDLGGGSPAPPIDPTPEQIVARRFPAQCGRHQERKHEESCGPCGRAKQELPEIRTAVARAKRARQIREQRERAAAQAALAASCHACGGTMRDADHKPCRECDPEWRDALPKGAGLALALDQVRG